MIVEVRPIETSKWHGKVKDESFTRPKKYNVLVDSEKMMYATGLTEKEEEEYGKKLKQDLSANYVPGEEHPFWDSAMAVIKLENKTQFFHTDRPLDYVKVRNLKASKYVANSMKEYNEGLWPEATHVIYDESEQVKIEASKVALQNDATLEQSKLSRTRKCQIILILDGKDLKNQSDDFITVEMSKLIQKDPGEVLRHIRQDETEVANHALVIEAIQKGILRKEGHKIKYLDSIVGNDELEAAEYLSDDENQTLKLRITKAVND